MTTLTLNGQSSGQAGTLALFSGTPGALQAQAAAQPWWERAALILLAAAQDAGHPAQIGPAPAIVLPPVRPEPWRAELVSAPGWVCCAMAFRNNERNALIARGAEPPATAPLTVTAQGRALLTQPGPSAPDVTAA